MKPTLQLIQKHLELVSNTFVPPLNSYVNVAEYSKKLFEKATLFFKIDQSQILGLVAAYDNSEKKMGWITNVSVDPYTLNKGIASSLLKECICFFQNKKYSTICLEVFDKNKKAINLYKKHGFTVQKQKENKIVMELDLLKRNYNQEFKDTADHKYAYSFDFDVMHHYMMKAFEPHFIQGNCLELGSFKGEFTKRLLSYFDDITCVEASDEALKIAQDILQTNKVKYFNSLFEEAVLPTKYDNIVLTHVLEHIDDPVALLSKIKNNWLTDKGKLFLVCPNANAASRQIAVKMGLISHNSAITPSEKLHGHQITYSLDTLERDVKLSGLTPLFKTGIFFKALANFQWDELLKTNIVTEQYLDGCYELGQQYPDLCSSIMIVCK